MMAVGKKGKGMTLNKWRRATEWFMTALALVFLFAYSWEVLARTHILLCEMVINIIWMVFIADCVVSILLAEDKKTWFKDNLLMLVSIALPVFRPLRLLRLVAVLNVLNRTQSYRWHGGAWAHHTVHMLQRDTTGVYRRPCRIGCGTWGSRRFHHRFR